VTDIRQINEDELQTLVAIANAAFPREEASPDEFVDWKRQAEDMAWFLTGDRTGAAFVLTGWHTPPGHAIGGIAVLPEHRGGGNGDRLLATIEAWAKERGSTHLEGGIAEDDDATIAWAGARGFEEVGRNSRLVLDLTAIDPPVVDPPAGIEIVTWAERPELAPGLWEVAREAGPDVPGEEDTDVGPLEEWLDRDMKGIGDNPEAVFVALEGDQVLGYAKLSFRPDSTDRAYHDLTGVLRAHRGRGIARALKAKQIAWAKEHGYGSLQTANEVRNEPIRRLNERHGYVLEPGTVIVRRAI
jgi:GNAT superfamily N-acetyltransferase